MPDDMAEVQDFRNKVQKLLEWQRHSQSSNRAIDNDNDITVQSTGITIQREEADSPPPQIDIDAALQASFTILLHPASLDHPPSTEQESHAFQILSMVVQLDEPVALLSEKKKTQTQLADVIYQLWFSTNPSINCRNLLEATLARGTTTASSSHHSNEDLSNSSFFVVERLLRTLQQTFSVGNKRSLQILVQLFDIADDALLQNTFPDLETKLVQSIHSQAGAQQSAKLLAKYALRKHALAPNQSSSSSASSPHSNLLDFLKPLVVQESHAARLAVYETLLPPILTKVPDIAPDLLDWLRSQPLKTSSTHLNAFLTLARLSVTLHPKLYTTGSEFDDLIEPSLIHANPSVRFEALRLLVSLPPGTAATRRFRLNHLDLHQVFWKYNLTDSDSPAVRTGLVGVWKEFITRARLSSNAAHKVVTKNSSRKNGVVVGASGEARQARDGGEETAAQGSVELAEAQAYITAVESFFTQWVTYATTHLLSIKPYRCKIGALTFLQILLEQNVDERFMPKSSLATNAKSKGKGKAAEVAGPPSWVFQLDILNEATVDMIIACVRSTYEDIRNAAHAILERTRLSYKQLQLVHDLGFLLVTRKRDAEISSATLYLRIITQMSTATTQMEEGLSSDGGLSATTNDPPFAYIVPRLLDLLEARIADLKNDFAGTAESTPVHGVIQAVSRLLPSVASSMDRQTLASICQRCLATVYDVWSLTMPILCRDVEDDNDEAEQGEDSSEEQVILNASWRSIKEASNLLCVILVLPINLKIQLWSPEELSNHAGLYASWLLQIGHRGVFAHVSQTYTRLCSELLRLKGPWDTLPPHWTENHLIDIIDVERPPKRRSAGLPYLLLGSLSSFPSGSPSFRNAFTRLFSGLETNAGSSDVTKTHILHCLRVLLQDGKMSAATKPYVQQAFSAAITGFGNDHWGIRNASLLLYASLIQRIFGNKREINLPLARRPSIVDFFSQYPDLIRELVAALAAGVNESQPEALGSVFAVLLLLSLLATPSDSPDAVKLALQFYKLVDDCARSMVWKVREAGAAALSGLVPETATLDRCKKILDLCTTGAKVNETHGRLLQVLALLGSRSAAASDEKETWPEILERLDTVAHLDQPLPVLTLILNILNIAPVELPQSIVIKLHCLASRHYGRRQPGDLTFAAALARSLLRVEPSRYLSKILSRPSPSAQCEALSYLVSSSGKAADEEKDLFELLLSLASSPDHRIDNRVLAASLLPSYISSPVPMDQKQALLRMYEQCKVPSMQEALLPAVSIVCKTSMPHRQMLLEQVAQMCSNESVSARMAGCTSLATLLQTGDVTYDSVDLLVGVLQDDDLAIRQQGSRIAEQLCDSVWPLCTTRALEAGFSACARYASHGDRLDSLFDILRGLQQTAALLTSASGVLFAVEKTNVHADDSLDLSKRLDISSALLKEEVVRKEYSDAMEKYTRELDRSRTQLAGTRLEEARWHELQHDTLFAEAELRARRLREVL